MADNNTSPANNTVHPSVTQHGGFEAHVDAHNLEPRRRAFMGSQSEHVNSYGASGTSTNEGHMYGAARVPLNAVPQVPPTAQVMSRLPGTWNCNKNQQK